MPGFHIEHFGCRAARADGEAIAGHLRALTNDRPLAADVVVVNTCSVTAEADRAARAYIRRTHRSNPAAKIVVTGCYAQRAPQELATLAGVAAVVGNSHKALVPEIIAGLACDADAPLLPQSRLIPIASLLARSGSTSAPISHPVDQNRSSGTPVSHPVDQNRSSGTPVWADDRFAHSFLEDSEFLPGAQTRPNLKIQEGCGNRCTFCVIPWTRGPSRSLPRAAVLRQVERFVAAGGKELVLSGINLGRWGRDLPAADQESLAQLVRTILAQTALPRLRLSSIEPMDWDDDLIALLHEFGGGRLARHAHLPLQSGSDAVLRRMHRRYRPWHYADKVGALLRAAGPNLTLGADVMAGFPGETDREFEEALAFIRTLPFGYLHLFPFSPRPGTRAWALHEAAPVPAAVVDERMAILRALAAEKLQAHRARFIGRVLPAITLNTPAALVASGRTSALTENFLPIDLDGLLPANQLVHVRVGALNAESVFAGGMIG
jgi:threonylcarbamoyladenosine tRNA methylthiotransferase MtaB